MTDTTPAQVGDTVRLTIVVEGEVCEAMSGALAAGGYFVNTANTTVEILSRATPPLPSEPGTWWLDKWSQVWWINAAGGMSCISNRIAGIPESYAPFRQLVLK